MSGPESCGGNGPIEMLKGAGREGASGGRLTLMWQKL